MADEPSAGSSRRWFVIVVALILIAGLAFAVGRFSTFGTQAAVSSPGTDSPEAGFSRDMQVHHAQAIEMAMEIYRKTDDEELRVLSYDIATGQAGQRGEMYDWLVQWGLPQSGGPMMQWMDAGDSEHAHGGSSADAMTDEEAHAAMGMASAAEIAALKAATGQQADCQFLALMIRHHEGAIPMAEALLELGADPRALEVATAIKNGQTAEIDAMKSIQTRLGCTD
ncbi:DUF305 domain-containing protein [Microbacterium trichothecenolyticum]|uniref:DUF305 domain-containing protein n=1 Tax=Microbacterium trichothecenolyticum TaxID=69370 RepID=UPI001C6F57E6|nr:DUF305 domain-containing protein [Microbacterium trichothecenolyticum]MBW9121364.1 DUF305 domain-containing protein [Microbacterium trichothecenolyticum]